MTKQSSENLPEDQLRVMANAIRILSADAVQAANSGHPGLPLGMADVCTILFSEFLKFAPTDPDWPDRDRFILSAGHGSMLLYALLHLCKYPDMTLDQIKQFRQLHAITAGHPEYGNAPGIETTTGPLGQGLANGVGMAIAEQWQRATFNEDLVNHKTYVLAGDGCLMEGISYEAISMAGHMQLANLVVLFDDNSITIDGRTDLSTSEDILKRFAASNWHTQAIDGHDFDQIREAINNANASPYPSVIACKTIIGFGAPNKQNSSSAHGSPLGPDEITALRKSLQWDNENAFEIPASIYQAWAQIANRGVADMNAWQNRLDKAEDKTAFVEMQKGIQAQNLHKAISAIITICNETSPKIATRAASQNVLDHLAAALPNLIGGSADLTGSNNTRGATMEPFGPDNYAGRYIHYGVREHAMAAAMAGMALHGGVVPYGGTFLVFSDYCRPSIRLAALMGIRVIYVFTHDSIGLGEDGPTHQPVEHLASLRIIPNVQVLRPADAIETAECWELALQCDSGPSILALTRQALPCLETRTLAKNRCAAGGYALADWQSDAAKLCIIATGSEVEIALNAAQELRTQNIEARVVSMPNREAFLALDINQQLQITGSGPRIVIEAGIKSGWEPVIGSQGAFIGMNSFGESAPAPALYEHFGITASKAVEQAKKLLGQNQ